jgi:hypothetical protein
MFPSDWTGFPALPLPDFGFCLADYRVSCIHTEVILTRNPRCNAVVETITLVTLPSYHFLAMREARIPLFCSQYGSRKPKRHRPRGVSLTIPVPETTIHWKTAGFRPRELCGHDGIWKRKRRAALRKPVKASNGRARAARRPARLVQALYRALASA